MEAIIFLLFLLAIAEWREQNHRHRAQPCGICHRRVKWVGLSQSVSGWTHEGVGVRATYSGLDDIPTLTHIAVSSGADL
jgi:hypothetical protein